MQTNEVKMLADHLGHDLNIHANIYSLQSSGVEKAKVAKILLAVQAGELHKLDKTTELNDVQIPTSIHVHDNGKLFLMKVSTVFVL